MFVSASMATPADAPEWQAFVMAHPARHLAHDWAWRDIVAAAFGQPSRHLIAREPGGRVVGVLPLVHVHSLLFGSALVSMPYLNGGGVLAASPEAARALRDGALALMRELQAGYLELRHRGAERSLDDFTVRRHKVAMTLPLQGDPEGLLTSFRSKFRNKVRRSTRNGFHAESVSGDAVSPELLNAYYGVFSRHMRDLGTPVYPKALFAETLAAFGRRSRLILVRRGKEPVAAGITLGQTERSEMPWASALLRVRDFRHNMLLHWQAIRAACDDGYRVFDFGRSTIGSGPHRFKEQWGCATVPLHWYYARGNGRIPDVNPQNPKFAPLVQCWRHLPLPLANRVGPYLARSLP